MAPQRRSETMSRTMTDSVSPDFDPAPLEEFATPGQIAEILEAFTEHCDRAMPQLADAVHARRARAIDRAAHSLAGSAGTVGAPVVSAQARSLCELARGESGEAGAALEARYDEELTRLQAAVDAARAAIARYMLSARD
jgi:HPt (histidine-containing phosphotransfer) domain-containing protein